MPVQNIAMLSIHTCPLAALGGKETGGMNVYVREISRELGRRGINIDIFTRCQNSRLPRVVKFSERVRVIHLKAGPCKPYPRNEVYNYLDDFLNNIIKFNNKDGRKYDLLHSHYWLSGKVCIDLKNLWGIPAIQMFHTLALLKNITVRNSEEKETILRINTEKEIVKYIDKIIASTDDEKLHLTKLYNAGSGKIEVIPCGVDLELFRPVNRRQARNKLGLGKEKIVLFVGRIEPIKGIETLLRSIAILLENRHKMDIKTIIIGGEKEESPVPNMEMTRIYNMVHELKLSEMVEFYGAKPQEILPYYYSAADVCVMPSRYESFGMVALEAMACGLPVIASRVGGLVRLIKDKLTGFLIPEGDFTVLARYLHCILTDEKKKRRMGEFASVYSREFGWPLIADKIFILYDRAVNGTPEFAWRRRKYEGIKKCHP